MTTGESRQVARPQPGVRLTPRGRALLAVAVVSALLLALLLAFWLGTVQASHAASGGKRGGSYASLVLHPGQTLWDVAERRAPGTDPRVMVHRIMQVNDLDQAAVWAGQRIRVPPPPE